MTQHGLAISSYSRKHRPTFRERVRAAIHRALRFEPREFSDLLGATLNCDPLIVKSILSEELSDHKVGFLEDDGGCRFYSTNNGRRAGDYQRLVSRRQDCRGGVRSTSIAETPLLLPPTWLTSLPEAAPVYSQWWFAPSLYPRLLRVLGTGGSAPQRAAFLGSPTLGALFSQVASGRTTVLDIDTEVLRSLSSQFAPGADVVEYDAAFELPSDLKGTFDLVFADPPWGRGSLRLFVRRASELASDGATVIVSFPQPLTRPGLQSELAALVESAASLGLLLQKRLRAATEYVVPEFERRAYQDAGIDLTVPWRKGDLFFFRKAASSQDRRSDSCYDHAPSSWWQTRFGKMRIFLRNTASDDRLAPSVQRVPGNAGFICPTTSSRSRVMQDASIVTTRNEVGIVHNWREVCEQLSAGKARMQQRLDFSCCNGHESGIRMVTDILGE